MKISEFITVGAALCVVSCGLKDVVEDVSSTVAIKDVKVTSDTIMFEPVLPEFEAGKTFSELLLEDSTKYSDPANYEVNVLHILEADNSHEGAENAQFNGGSVSVTVDSSSANAIAIEDEEGFDIAAGATVLDTTEEAINADDNRVTCLYVFKHIVSGDNVAGDIDGSVRWELGTKEGSIPLPSVPFSVPTRVSDETKQFLSGAIDAGVFD